MANQPTRNSSGQFVKGQSGNPSGRSKQQTVLVDDQGRELLIDDLLRLNGQMVFLRHLSLIMDKKTPPGAAVSAIKEYYERWLGKSPNQVVVRAEDDSEAVFDVSKLSKPALAEIVDLSKARKGE